MTIQVNSLIRILINEVDYLSNMEINRFFVQGFRLPGQEISISDPILSKSLTLTDILQFGITLLFVIAIIGALIFLIWGGVSWITSGGDKEKLDKARKTIIFAIIGLIVVLLSFVIMNFIGNIMGVKTFQGSKNRDNTQKNRPYDCPDGSDSYYCGINAENASYKDGCPICGPDPLCQNGRWSVAYCSTDNSKPSGCYSDEDCTGHCALGKKAVPYCDLNIKNPNGGGTCKTNCVDDIIEKPGGDR